jgi:hypothetical protein
MTSSATGEVGRMLASAELLKRGVLTARPDNDVGFDIVTVSGGKFCRVQVKTTSKALRSKRAYRFCIGRGRNKQSRRYTEKDVDVFVFVAIESGSFWVVPSKEMTLTSKWYTARLDSRWKDAWHVLT